MSDWSASYQSLHFINKTQRVLTAPATFLSVSVFIWRVTLSRSCTNRVLQSKGPATAPLFPLLLAVLTSLIAVKLDNHYEGNRQSNMRHPAMQCYSSSGNITGRLCRLTWDTKRRKDAGKHVEAQGLDAALKWVCGQLWGESVSSGQSLVFKLEVTCGIFA